MGLGGLLAVGGKVLLNWRRLVAEDVVHHLDPLPLVVGELNQFVLPNLQVYQKLTFHSSFYF